jgi:hypothetical protein
LPELLFACCILTESVPTAKNCCRNPCFKRGNGNCHSIPLITVVVSWHFWRVHSRILALIHLDEPLVVVQNRFPYFAALLLSWLLLHCGNSRPIPLPVICAHALQCGNPLNVDTATVHHGRHAGFSRQQFQPPMSKNGRGG